jgi:hypothetical protein
MKYPTTLYHTVAWREEGRLYFLSYDDSEEWIVTHGSDWDCHCRCDEIPTSKVPLSKRPKSGNAWVVNDRAESSRGMFTDEDFDNARLLYVNFPEVEC